MSNTNGNILAISILLVSFSALADPLRDQREYAARSMEEASKAAEQQRIAYRDARLRSDAAPRPGCEPDNLWKFVAIDQSIIIEPDLNRCLDILIDNPNSRASAWKLHRTRSPATIGPVSDRIFVLGNGTFGVETWVFHDNVEFRYKAEDGKYYTVGKFDNLQNVNSTYSCLQNNTCRVDPAGDNAPRPTMAGHTMNSNLYYFMEYDEELTRTLGYWVPYHQSSLPGIGLIFDAQPAMPPVKAPAEGNSEVYLPIRKQAPGY